MLFVCCVCASRDAKVPSGLHVPQPEHDRDSSYQRHSTAMMRRAATLGRKLEGGSSAAAVQPGNVSLPSNLHVAEQLTGRTGSLMYMAPEAFKLQQYTEKVDVFAFGVIMYELFHRYLMICAVSTDGTDAEVEAYAERLSHCFRWGCCPLTSCAPAQSVHAKQLLNVCACTHARACVCVRARAHARVRMRVCVMFAVLSFAQYV
jgi:hypothetical protein